jgi:hypothetical protein
MKDVAWNILTIVALLAIIGLAFVALTIYSNPASLLNPFPPPTLPARVSIPTITLTPIFLPATWTPQPEHLNEIQPSSTPIPSATTFTLGTETPSPSPTETITEVVLLPSSSPTELAYSCMLAIAKPLNGSNVDYDSGFDGSWVVKNGGTETWDSSQVEVRYLTGTKLQTKADTLKLPRVVPPGSSVRLTVDMKAPADVGTFYSTWGLVLGDRVFCRWTIAITVPTKPQ